MILTSLDGQVLGPQYRIEMTDIVDRFVSCIEKNEQSLVTGKDGIQVMRLIDACHSTIK